MISIIVERAPGDSQGKDITDPLLTSEAQGQQLGRSYIDESFANKFDVSGSCVLNDYMEPGKTVQVTDLESGSYNAVLKSYSASITRQADGSFTAVSDVILERLA